MHSVLEALRTELETLREENAQLRAELYGTEWTAPLEWGLTRTQARIMAVLVAREMATHENLVAGVWWNRGKEEPSSNCLNAMIHKLRHKIAPFGVTIRTLWGRGYAIPACQRSALAVGAVSVPSKAGTTPKPGEAAHA